MRSRALLLVLALFLATAAPAAEVVLEEVARGLNLPLGVVSAGDERLFAVTKPGQVMIVDPDGTVRPEPFLDLSHRVHASAPDYRSERGLLGLAFHPDHATNGYVFAFWSAADNDSVLARYELVPGDPDRADPASEAILLRIPQPGRQHKGGQLQFGPDGFLYVSTGDGSFEPEEPLCTAQDRGSLLGKVLRLDVDSAAGEPPFYTVPADNPFRAESAADAGEVFLYGFRNPWRFSFDRVTGDLYIADVGDDRREEIDVVPAGALGGGNFGWPRMEGSLCGAATASCDTGTPPCGDSRYQAPAFEYEHGNGRCSVIGGYVYRGTRVPGLYGAYVFGDLCGDLFVASRDRGTWGYFELAPGLRHVVSFGEDVNGELLLVAGDAIYRLAASDVVDPRRGALRLVDETAGGREGEWLTVRVAREGGGSGAVSVAYATADGTAVADEDYVPTSGVLSWPDGDRGERSFQVRLLDDDRVEGTETVRVELSAAAGGAVTGVPSAADLEVADADVVAGPCVADATTHCLRGGRFRVTAHWDDGARSDAARALSVTDDTGAFWFFGAGNVELLVKVLDGCGFTPPRYWVFAAGLTDVAVTLRVVDTVTGNLWEHHNPAGTRFPPIQDTTAFATCP